MQKNLGFMQGRLVDQIEGKIQAFPLKQWKDEFERAKELQLTNMEWTLDFDEVNLNPIFSSDGRDEISSLSKEFGVNIPSLTADSLMQRPFWKATGREEQTLIEYADLLLSSCALAGIGKIVVPLVDNGSIASTIEEQKVKNFFLSRRDKLNTLGLTILFEVDMSPATVARFIANFEDELFGVNYDIGNSIGSGFKTIDEFEAYGNRIKNVHIKDKKRGGTTVPLGCGDADFSLLFSLLCKFDYSGNLIFQAARCPDGNHVQRMKDYMMFIKEKF